MSANDPRLISQVVNAHDDLRAVGVSTLMAMPLSVRGTAGGAVIGAYGAALVEVIGRDETAALFRGVMADLGLPPVTKI